MEVTVNTENDFSGRRLAVAAYIGLEDIMSHAMPELIMRDTARIIAERIAEEYFQDIVAAIDPQALANLTIAESAAQIHRTLKEKLPDKIVEVHKTKREVYQRGIFGGLRRVG